MSNISNVHSVQPFDSKTSKALDGQRLSKITYKNTEKTPAKFPSVCVSLPQVSLSADDMTALQGHIEVWFAEQQDKVIRNLYEAAEGQLQEVSDSQISVAAVLEYLEAESTGGRLTGEAVKTWFDSELADALQVAFEVKLGVSENPTPEQEKKLAQAVNIYRDNFAKLASGRAQIPSQVAESMIRALDIAEVSDTMGVRFKVRLEKMVATEVDMLELL